MQSLWLEYGNKGICEVSQYSHLVRGVITKKKYSHGIEPA
jgi:hypothetical protein